MLMILIFALGVPAWLLVEEVIRLMGPSTTSDAVAAPRATPQVKRMVVGLSNRA